MTIDSRIETLESGRVRRVRLFDDGAPLTFAEAVAGWQRDAGFRDTVSALLAEDPRAAFFWETPPVTRSTVDRPFEFVLVESRALAGPPPDPDSFAEHFRAAAPTAEVVTFPNLGGDALLVAPLPRAPLGVYPHLAAFCRGAPAPQRHALWRAVGCAVADRLADRRLWLSTSGLGIAWLHVRLDSVPKYYTFDAYRRH